MNVLDGKADLREQVEEFIFCEGLAGSFALLDQLVEAASISKLHHDVPVKLLVFERSLKLDNVRVIECLQDSALIAHLLSQVLVQVCSGDTLDHKVLVSDLRSNLESLSEAALSERAQHFVAIFAL